MATFVDPFYLIVTLVMVVLLVVLNVFFIAKYAHKNDSVIATSASVKALIVRSVFVKLFQAIAFMCAQCQILLLLLDVANYRTNSNVSMKIFWYIVFMTSAFFLIIILPFAFYYYQADEELSFVRIYRQSKRFAIQKLRLWTAAKYEILTILVVTAVLFATYAGLRFSDFPLNANTCIYTQPKTMTDKSTLFTVATDTYSTSSCTRLIGKSVRINVSFPIYVITIASFMGWFLLWIFLSSGLMALPLDLINFWRSRPVSMKADEFIRKKHELSKDVEKLLAIGRKISEEKNVVQNEKSCCMLPILFKLDIGLRHRKNRSLTIRQNEFETNCVLAERQYKKLSQTSEYSKSLDPCYYYFALVLALLGFGVSMLLLTHIFTEVLLFINGKSLSIFLNILLEQLEVSKISILAYVAFGVISYYMFFAALKGSVKASLRFFSLGFFHLQPGETFVNGFVFNAILMNLWSFSLIQLITDLFREFLQGTQISIIYTHARYMIFYQYFFQFSVFVYALTVGIFVSVFYFLLKPVERIQLGDEIKQKDLPAKV